MKKVVLDTNIIISAILFGGKPQEILLLVLKGKIWNFISRYILEEVRGVLRKKFSFSEEKLDKIEWLLGECSIVVEPDFSLAKIKNKPADNRILEAAVFAGADYLISGDTKHLLPLGKIKKTKIVSAEGFLRIWPKGKD